MAYNGHKNWNQWNVSLWINNDEGLYGIARNCILNNPTRVVAAKGMLSFLASQGATKTPDGAPYSATAILNAMRGMI